MHNDFINIDALKLSAPDSLSRFVTMLLTNFARVGYLNKLTNSIPIPISDPQFTTEFLKLRSGNIRYSNCDFPDVGPAIFSLPISSGIIDFIISYSSIYQKTHRSDIRFLTTNKHFASIKSISPYFLDVKSFNITSVFKSAVAYLQNGGTLIYLNRITRQNTDLYTTFKFPFRLSECTNAALYALRIDSDYTPPIYSLPSINDCFYLLLSIRSLLSHKNSNFLLTSSKISQIGDFDTFYSTDL